jgi:hypothetical protein
MKVIAWILSICFREISPAQIVPAVMIFALYVKGILIISKLKPCMHEDRGNC